MFATRIARLAVVFLLLTTLPSCSRRHESQDFLPSAPSTQDALQIVNEGQIAVPADGVSTVKIEAQISPDANVSRLVRFATTLGGWLEGAGAGAGAGAAAQRVGGGQQAELPKIVDKEADTSGRAAALLQSTSTEGTALVTISVIAKDAAGNVTDTYAVVTTEVTFTQVSDALTLTVSPAEGVADGASEVELVAQIADGSPSSWQTVVFETSLGRLGGTMAAPVTMVDVTADGTRTARARLVSDDEGTATVSAKIKEFASASVTQLVIFGTPPSGELSVTPEGLDFGSVTVDTTKELGLTLGNHGSVPLQVTALAIAPTGQGFTVSLSPALPTNIPPGGSVALTVRYAPTATGSNSASLTITSDDAARPTVTVSLAGVAVAAAPNIAVDPASLAFGDVSDATTEDLVLTVENTGTATLSVTDISSSNAEFTIESSTSFSVAPGGTAPVTVRFDPDGVGAESGVVEIDSNDPQDPVVAVPVSGTGT